MPLPASRVYTSEDYWNLPDGVRAELIDGELYDMAPPDWVHQAIVAGIVTDLNAHIRRHSGNCKAVPAPVAVNLDANDETWVEPDVVVVCDSSRISKRGVEGAPDGLHHQNGSLSPRRGARILDCRPRVGADGRLSL